LTLKIKLYKTVILPFILPGCETSSLTLREGTIDRVFMKRVLRRTSGSEREEVTEGWRKLHNEELQICTLHKILLG
jgi:hypothetical protein